MHSRGARLARGWVVGAVATAAAALSHALAGGGTPSWLALALGVVFSGLLGTVATGPRPSLVRLALSVGLGQLAFHAAFSYLGTSTPAAPTGAPPHHHMADMTSMPAMAAAPDALHHADGPLMWAAHALAAIATVLFLRHAERALWSLLTRVALRVVARFRGVTAPVAVAMPRVAAVTSPPLLSSGIRLLSTASRRGPPLSAAL